jgi:ubiquinone/menaquinone biosynthesis C-methylase UbiE
MNRAHHWICRSRWWKQSLATELIPWALEGLSLGPTTLEIGCGPGVSTAVLARRTTSLTCVELDPSQALWLSDQLPGTHTRILCGDASALPLNASSFHSVVGFTMLHHVKPTGKQDALFREVARVLQPGGVFAGTDSCDGRLFRMLHWGDTLQPPDPESLPQRLRAAGFDDVEMVVRKREFRFRAWRGPV